MDLINELKKESSPYLLQHAHNPVHWQVWSTDLLELAQKLNKPLLISIGYSSCHWCHVMERESFENKDIAEVMNSHFINVKIDREERPDLDHFFMDALQALTGKGGWPLHIFATPEGLPFFGGTYFPPKRMGQHLSWLEILEFVSGLWLNKQPEVLSQANNLMAYLHKKERLFSGQINLPQTDDTDDASLLPLNIAEKIILQADKENGGFGSAPKFPQFSSLQFLFAVSFNTGNDTYKKHAVFTLKKMLSGGIFDHLGGGISRYSTDEEWLVPHFEKMLYDNSMLMTLLCEAHQITGDSFFAEVLEKTIAFCERDLKCNSGGYYTALDADSEGVEGKYYLWSKQEIEEVLGVSSTVFCHYYGVTEYGNWEEKNILNIRKEVSLLASTHNKSVAEINQIINAAEKKLLDTRYRRKPPLTDTKIILAQNAQLLSALSKASGSFQNERYQKLANELYEFLVTSFVTENIITSHCIIAEKPKYKACLDDYAYLIQSFIKYYEASANKKALQYAYGLMGSALKLFSAVGSPFLYFSAEDQTDVVQRKTIVYDSPIPSGNAIMCESLLMLAYVFNENVFQERATQMISSMKKWIASDPNSFALWATLDMALQQGFVQIIIGGQNAAEKMKETNSIYFPTRLLLAAENKEDWPVAEKFSHQKENYFSICKGNSCVFSADNELLPSELVNFTRI